MAQWSKSWSKVEDLLPVPPAPPVRVKFKATCVEVDCFAREKRHYFYFSQKELDAYGLQVWAQIHARNHFRSKGLFGPVFVERY